MPQLRIMTFIARHAIINMRWDALRTKGACSRSESRYNKKHYTKRETRRLAANGAPLCGSDRTLRGRQDIFAFTSSRQLRASINRPTSIKAAGGKCKNALSPSEKITLKIGKVSASVDLNGYLAALLVPSSSSENVRN